MSQGKGKNKMRKNIKSLHNVYSDCLQKAEQYEKQAKEINEKNYNNLNGDWAEGMSKAYWDMAAELERTVEINPIK